MKTRPGISRSVRLTMLALCAATLAPPAFAEDSEWPLPEGPLGQQLCMTCHGSFGQGSAIVGGPNLAGMEPWYLRRQLHNFAHALRGTDAGYVAGYEMQHAVAPLDAAAIEAVVAEVSAWPPLDPPATLAGDVAHGAVLYQSCAACHGSAAEGNEALAAPALAARNDWYLLRQLELFKSGGRGAHPDDTAGAQMRAMTDTLADTTAMVDVLSYINTLPWPAPL